MSKLLKAGKFKFKLNHHQMYALKKRKKFSNESRIIKSLTINNLQEKVVQQAIYFILNIIYEPSFLNSSHGSRPNRGNHSALRHIKYYANEIK